MNQPDKPRRKNPFHRLPSPEAAQHAVARQKKEEPTEEETAAEAAAARLERQNAAVDMEHRRLAALESIAESLAALVNVIGGAVGEVSTAARKVSRQADAAAQEADKQKSGAAAGQKPTGA